MQRVTTKEAGTKLKEGCPRPEHPFALTLRRQGRIDDYRAATAAKLPGSVGDPGADVVRSGSPDPGLVLPFLSSQGWANGSRRLFFRREMVVSCACLPPVVPWPASMMVFYDEHGAIVAEASSVPVVPPKRCADRKW